MALTLNSGASRIPLIALLLFADGSSLAEEDAQPSWEAQWFEKLSKFSAAPNDVVREEIVEALETHGRAVPDYLDGWAGTLQVFRKSESGDAVGGVVALADPCGGTPHKIVFYSPVKNLNPEVWARRNLLKEGILVELRGRVVDLDLDRNARYAALQEREATPPEAPPAPQSPPPSPAQQQPVRSQVAGAPGGEAAPETAGASGGVSVRGIIEGVAQLGINLREALASKIGGSVAEETVPQSPKQMAVEQASQPRSILSRVFRRVPRPTDLADEIVSRNPELAARIPEAVSLYVALDDLAPFDSGLRHAEDVTTAARLSESITGTVNGLLPPLQATMASVQKNMSCDALLRASQSADCAEAPLKAKNFGFTCPDLKGSVLTAEAVAARRDFLATELAGVSRAASECRFDHAYKEALTQTADAIQEFLGELNLMQADSRYLARCLPEKTGTLAPTITVQPISPPHGLKWGMTYDELAALWGKRKLKGGAYLAVAHLVRYNLHVAGEAGDLSVGLDSRKRVVMTLWTPALMSSTYGGFDEDSFTPINTRDSDTQLEQLRVGRVLRLERFWASTVDGISEKYGPPYSSSAAPRALKPGEKLNTLWQDADGNQIELVFERSAYGSYSLELHYRATEYVETAKGRASDAF